VAAKKGKTQMKKLITICSILLVLIASNSAKATLWEIMDAGLQDTANFVQQTGGTLNSRSDIASDPGTRFNVTLTGTSWMDIQIGDGYDLPSDNSGLVAATGNASSGNTWFGDLSVSSGYSGYTMTIENPNTSGGFMAGLYLNTGWTDSPTSEPDNYYQSAWTWVTPGTTVTLTLDVSSGVLNRNHVSNIGLKIGTNVGTIGNYNMPSGTTFNVDIVPEPATIGLLSLGALSLLRRKR
jgi:hypothetical protein